MNINQAINQLMGMFPTHLLTWANILIDFKNTKKPQINKNIGGDT